MDDDESFEVLQLFQETHADTAVCCRRPSDADVTRLAPIVPGGLLRFWREYGWCSYMDGLLRLVDPADHPSATTWWNLGAGAIVIGRSGFGDLLVVSAGKLATIFVHSGRFQWHGALPYDESLATLFDPDDCQDLFFGELYREAVDKHGAPGPAEMFTFEPALALGGDVTIEHVRRVKADPALAIVAQLVGDLKPI